MIRRLTPTRDARPYARIADERQRVELLEHVVRTAPFRAGEGEPSRMARLEYEIDHMPLLWRTVIDMDLRAPLPLDYDAAAAAYGERR